ncbi:MAG: SUMF1/EgtB/PvdO family nonheme iron enzyme [Planctomycetota bacterium]
MSSPLFITSSNGVPTRSHSRWRLVILLLAVAVISPGCGSRAPASAAPGPVAAPDPVAAPGPATSAATPLLAELERSLEQLQAKSPQLLDALKQYRVELAKVTADLRSSLARTGATLEQARSLDSAKKGQDNNLVTLQRLDRRATDVRIILAKLDDARSRNSHLVAELQYVLRDLKTKEQVAALIDNAMQDRARELLKQAENQNDLSPLRILEDPKTYIEVSDAQKQTAEALTKSLLPARPEKQLSDLPALPILDFKAANAAEQFLLDDLRGELEKGRKLAEEQLKKTLPEAAIESLQRALTTALQRVDAYVKVKTLSWQTPAVEQISAARKALSEQLAGPYMESITTALSEARGSGNWNAVLDLLEAVARLAPATEKLTETITNIETVLKYRANIEDLDAIVAHERLQEIKSLITGVPYAPQTFKDFGKNKNNALDITSRQAAQNALGMACRVYLAQTAEILKLLQRFNANAPAVQTKERERAVTLNEMSRLLAARDREDQRLFVAYNEAITERQTVRAKLVNAEGLRADSDEVKAEDQKIAELRSTQSHYAVGHDRATGKAEKPDPKTLVDDYRNLLVGEVNSIGMVMVRIPKGTFTMGSPETESGRDSDEAQVPVTISKDFLVGAYEVTNSQSLAWLNDPSVTYDESWMDLDGGPIARSGRTFSLRTAGTGNRPVTHISWFGAKAFCAWLSKKEGRVYRLPTDAEWEYMARAGTSTAYPWGDTWVEGKANVGSSGVQDVGQYAPNGWGVFDSVGNVYEWTEDWYSPERSGGVDPAGPAKGSARCIRGGSCSGTARHARSANRNGLDPSDRDNDLGFRVAASPMGPPASGATR